MITMRDLLDITDKKPILKEHYVNVSTPKEMVDMMTEVFELVEKAYENVPGGHLNFQKPADLLDSSFWKLVRRNEKLITAVIYKDRQGRKLVAVGHDGSRAGRDELKKIFAEDIEHKRMWAEVSGGFADYCIKQGIPPVPNDQAKQLLQKQILDKKGIFKYDRILAGHVHTKMIIGYPNGVHYEILGPWTAEDTFFGKD